MSLILASSSPYRQDLLTRLGLAFVAIAPDVDETPLPGEAPGALAQRLAIAKARRISVRHPGAVVIGSDQVAAVGTQFLGKPGTAERARAQLHRLSGQTVIFHTALCVTNGKEDETATVLTECRFRRLCDDEIHQYLKREQPYDTAGSAKAEGLGIALMEHVRSDDPTAIIGLPLITLCTMLRNFGRDPVLDGVEHLR